MKKVILSLLLSMGVLGAMAQIQEPEQQGGYDYGTEDSTTAVQYDENGNPINPEENGEEEQVVVKPYERIKLSIDSITNLISYGGVVEQEETGSDSLYVRAKRWAQNRFAKGSKSIFEIDKKNQKIVMNGYITAYAYGSKYAKRDIGQFQFKLTLWIKEGRYKYQVSNFVHVGIKPNNGEAPRNYFEFYYNSPTNVKGYDKILRAADQDVNKLIEEFKKYMKDPIIVDEEDW